MQPETHSSGNTAVSISLQSETDKDNLSQTILEVLSISSCNSKLEFDSTKDATLLDVKSLFSSTSRYGCRV